MATKYTLRQGESEVLEIIVLDENGQALDVSTSLTTNIVVSLVNKGVIFAKYSLVDMGVGFGDLTTTSNIVKLIVTRDETKLWATGYASAVITIEQDDVDLTHRVYDFEQVDFLTVLGSSNKDYTLIHS